MSGRTPVGSWTVVSISAETPEQTDERLRGVVAAAEIVVLPGAWAFTESPAGQPPVIGPEVVAVVRDESSWSCLGPAADDAEETFALFSFHFPGAADNSGFVGWLATELKTRLGTGVFVVCGQNSARGGIYDYWGVPVSLADHARAVIERLRA